VIQYIHHNGQKAGIYWIPGVQNPVYTSTGTVCGDPNNDTLASIADPNEPGNAFAIGSSAPYWHAKMLDTAAAQYYLNSVVDLFASWGVDFIKIDGIVPGSDRDSITTIDNRPDVEMWSKAIAQSGRPMWLELSWALDKGYASVWQTWANGRRIDDDADCYCRTLTNWSTMSSRFSDLPAYRPSSAGPTVGWNDLDSMEVGNGTATPVDGLTQAERRTVMTLWAIANSPMFAGDDLTKLDSYGISLLTNANVIAVDQTGQPGNQITGGKNQVWASPLLPNGTYNVALFNLKSSTSSTTVKWSSLGFSGSADVYDLWAGSDLGSFSGSYTAPLASHGSALLKVTPGGCTSAVPGAPSKLTATGTSGAVALRWKASSGATIYNIYRGTASGGEMQVYSGITENSYRDSNVVAGTKYYYKVAASSCAAGTSSKSVEASATPAAAVIPIASGDTYIIVNKNSGLVLNDPGSSTSKGTRLNQWQSDGGANQQWTATQVGSFWTFTNVASGLLLDVPNGSTSPGVRLDQWQANGSVHQNWIVVAVGDGTYRIVSQVSGLDMEVSGSSTSNGAAVDQYTDNGEANQHWTFQLVN
jgi:hypothetical protein